MSPGHRPDGGPVIDCHSHLLPSGWSQPSSPPSMFDLDGLLAEQERGGVDMSVVGNNWIRTPTGYSRLDAAKTYNEFAAEVTSKHPGRLLGLACCIPFGDDQMLAETE